MASGGVWPAEFGVLKGDNAVLSKSLVRFLRDERGSYTVWSVLWFMIYVGIGGLAVDVTNVFRHQSMLQATADAAALAGVMSLPDENKAKYAARLYAQHNMRPEYNGYVLEYEDIQVGVWDFSSETFVTPGSDTPNAVHVTTRRAQQNENPVTMNLLRILGMFGLDTWWNVQAEAVAVRGLEACYNNGIIAGGQLTMSSQSSFRNFMCLHGDDGIKFTQDNFFEAGVAASVGCAEGESGCLMPNARQALSDPDFAAAFELGGEYEEDRPPTNAENVPIYLQKVVELAQYVDGNGNPGAFEDFVEANNTDSIDFSGWGYLADANGFVPEYHSHSGSTFPDWALSETGEFVTEAGQYAVFDIECDASGSFDLPSGTYRNVAIVTTCPISLSASISVDLQGVMIGVDWWDGANPTTQNGLKFAGNANMGHPECGKGSVELMTAASSVHFAAGGQINNSRILSGWDIKMAAGGAGEVGLHMEAINDIEITTGGSFGLCPFSPGNFPNLLTYALVR